MHQQKLNDTIHLTDIIEKLPPLIRKVPHLLSGLKQAYLRTPETPTGLGIAFEKAVQQNPYGMALLFEEQRFSYRELNEWANQIGHFYLSVGARKGDVIAVMIENRPELIATILALAKIGVTIALINTSQSAKALMHSINLVQPIAVIAGEECRSAIEDVRADLAVAEDRFYWFADQATRIDAGKNPKKWLNLAHKISNFPKFNTPTTRTIQGKDGLFYLYTSGTTGLPKAVIFNHSRWTLAYGTYGHVLNLNKDDVMYVTLPMYHATGVVVCWCGVLAGHATLALRRKYSTSCFWNDVKKFDASAIGYVGELCRYLIDAPVSELERGHRVTKMIGNGMRPNIWEQFKTRFGIKEILELYASSEGNVGFTNLFNFDNTVGFSPTPYAIVEFDKENNIPVKDANGWCKKVNTGETGLLIGKITARSPFDGYTDTEKNKAVIMHDVFKHGDAYFNTGDLMRNMGFRHAQFIDRLGDTFRWKGENVSTTEVENAVSDYAKIAEAVVYGVEIPNTNGRAGIAAITLLPNMQLTEADLTQMATEFKKCLPAYAVPLFLRVQLQLQTTGTFKYQKNSLKEQAFDPSKTEERLLVLLPNAVAYCDLTADIFKQIQAYQYRF